MADEQQELRSVNWNEVFAFTHIFKSFRMAIHPSKIMLALAAIVVICVGGRVMDLLWGGGSEYVMRDEITTFATGRAGELSDSKTQWKRSRPAAVAELMAGAANEAQFLNAYTRKLPAGRLATAFAEQLAAANAELERVKPFELRSAEQFRAEANEDWKGVLDKAGGEFGRETDRIGSLLSRSRDQVSKVVDEMTGEEARADKRKLREDYVKARQALAERKREFAEAETAIRGSGIFDSLSDYEGSCLGNAVSAVWRGDISGGLDVYATGSAPAAAVSARPMGFLFWMLMAVQGIGWLFSEHWVYAVVFLVLSLGSWALFGGAVHRIAALHAAREEKISAAQALRFSVGKFISFFTAPLIPLAIVLALGLLMALGGFLFGNFGGGIILGLLLLVAILMGLLIAFLLIGLGGGAALMYPTVAVEGSDSFDAFSRSFSYVFARPWRSMLYGLVALFYGAICYLFVRLFVFLALAATHYFVNWGVFTGGSGLSPAATRLDVLWSAPTFHNLHGAWNWAAMTGAEKVAAVLVGVWVYLIAAGVVAFALSYLASSTTVIYYLLRRKVDATDLDDVYVEESPAEQPLEGPGAGLGAEAPAPAEQTGEST